MKDRNLKIIFGLLSTLLFIGLIYKLTKIPGGMILPGYFLGGITLIGVIIVSLIIVAIAKHVFKSFSFMTLFAITTTLAFIGFHYYLYSPTLKIIVPNGYTGTINLVLSDVDNNILTVDSNGIGYLNKWTFEKTYSKPIVKQIDGQNLDSNCVGFNPSTFWGYSKFCCVNGKTIKSLSFELERKTDSGQNQFRAKGFSQYVDTKKHTDKLLPTQVLLQVGLDFVTSAVVRYQQQFHPTNKAKLKFLSSSFKSLLSIVRAGQSLNSPPAAILNVGRYAF